MIFAKTVTTNKNTVAATPLVTTWPLVSGLIYRFELYFPPGPCGLVGVALHTASHRIYPFGENEWFIGDNVTIAFDDEMLFDIETRQLELHSYNLDEKFNHQFQCRLGIISDPQLIASKFGVQNIEKLTDRMTSLISLLEKKTGLTSKFSTQGVDLL